MVVKRDEGRKRRAGPSVTLLVPPCEEEGGTWLQDQTGILLQQGSGLSSGIAGGSVSGGAEAPGEPRESPGPCWGQHRGQRPVPVSTAASGPVSTADSDSPQGQRSVAPAAAATVPPGPASIHPPL